MVTSNKRGADTDANVYIQLFGDKNYTKKVRLNDSKAHFKRGQTDVFELNEEDVGALQKIIIGHDGRGVDSGWHLKEVIITAPKLGKTWTFPCDRWLSQSEDDGKIERELTPFDAKIEQELTPSDAVCYEITVFTSEIRGADTLGMNFKI